MSKRKRKGGWFSDEDEDGVDLEKDLFSEAESPVISSPNLYNNLNPTKYDEEGEDGKSGPD